MSYKASPYLVPNLGFLVFSFKAYQVQFLTRIIFPSGLSRQMCIISDLMDSNSQLFITFSSYSSSLHLCCFACLFSYSLLIIRCRCCLENYWDSVKVDFRNLLGRSFLQYGSQGLCRALRRDRASFRVQLLVSDLFVTEQLLAIKIIADGCIVGVPGRGAAEDLLEGLELMSVQAVLQGFNPAN